MSYSRFQHSSVDDELVAEVWESGENSKKFRFWTTYWNQNYDGNYKLPYSFDEFLKEHGYEYEDLW